MRQWFVLTTILILWGTIPGFVFSENLQASAALMDTRIDLAALEECYGRLTPLTGEILSVDSNQIILVNHGEKHLYQVDETTMIWANERTSCLKALRPVAEYCYFSARVWIDDNGRIRAIEGFYRGAEVYVMAVTELDGNRYRLIVQNLEQDQTPYEVETAAYCYRWETLRNDPTGAAYLLFNLDGEVKGIFR